MATRSLFLPFYTRTCCIQITRQFQTTPPRHIPPLIWVFLRPAIKGVAWISGRSVRKWWKALPTEKRSVFFDHILRQRLKYFGIFGGIGTLATVHYVTHLQTSPITGRRRYLMMNSEQLYALGDLEKQKIMAMFGNKMLAHDSKQTQLVAKVAYRLIAANLDIEAVKNIKWCVRVVDTDTEKNAFVLPSGDIYATKGLLGTMTNEDQLAVVLAHELSHAVLSHAAEQISYHQVIDLLAIFGAFIIWAIMPTDWTSFWVNWIFEGFMTITSRLPYSRKLEEEADEVGLLMAAKACYDVREAVNFWETMSKSELQLPEFVSTHPASDKRAETLLERLPWALNIRNQCNCAKLPDRPLGKLYLENAKVNQTLNTGGFGHVTVVKTNE